MITWTKFVMKPPVTGLIVMMNDIMTTVQRRPGRAHARLNSYTATVEPTAIGERQASRCVRGEHRDRAMLVYAVTTH